MTGNKDGGTFNSNYSRNLAYLYLLSGASVVDIQASTALLRSCSYCLKSLIS